MDPILLTTLSKRIERIVQEVTINCIQSARSSTIQARDFSVTIADGQCRTVTIHGGLPIHTMSIDLALKPVPELFDDIAPGDTFLNNCPYYGNVHHADYTFMTPVFAGDRILFWIMLRMHNVDVGAPEPTAYLPFAGEIYQEGLHWPVVRVARDHKELADLVRIGMLRIRVPDQWYGDFAAALGSSHIGEARLRGLIDEYGTEVIDEFIEEWLDYGRRRMVAEIKSLPEGTWEEETHLDPLPYAPDGLKIKIKMTVDHAREMLTIDLRDNPDQVDGGINLPIASSIAAPAQGIFACLDYTLPHNTGCFERIEYKLREGSICGIPIFPAGTSVSTSYVTDRLTSAAMALMAKIDPDRGGAEGGYIGWQEGVFSGKDFRRNDDPYVSQPIVVGSFVGGGPATRGHDGWPAWGIGGTQGCVTTTSVELWEKNNPHIFDVGAELITDSVGDGEFVGSVGSRLVIKPRRLPFTVAGYGDGREYPPKGVLGGGPGHPNEGFIVDEATGDRIEELPLCGIFEIEMGRAFEIMGNGGGGFGSPLDRDPEVVRTDVLRRWISRETANEVYGVVLDFEPEEYSVDVEATSRLRSQKRKAQDLDSASPNAPR